MLTPMDIHNKEFKRSFRGYNENEVDEFLDKVSEDYEILYKENSDLKDRINLINDKLQSYNNMEKTLNNTLIVAQNTAEGLKQNAAKEAELIIQEAQQNAEIILQKANQEVVKIRTELENLKKKLNIFKAKFKILLEGQLESVLSIDENEFFEEEGESHEGE
ncbi:MAG: DivIVA domain-containing protein [Thermoanaerobacteraceae bacterium]|nr:DivIVA domain-containing protein [Thermoanaerobacteraceae bacterium]